MYKKEIGKILCPVTYGPPCTLKDINCIDQHVIRLIQELLEMFENLQSFIFHFYDTPRFPSIVPFIDLNRTIQLLNMEEFAEIYQIKHIHNYLQFIKKED